MHLSGAFQGFHGAVSYPLASGDAGISQTIDLIRSQVDLGVKSPAVNEATLRALREASTPQFDDLSAAQAVYSWVQRNIRYVPDPVNKETVRPADVILRREVMAGDCDDINGVLLPSMVGTIGIPTRLVTVAADPAMPDQFTHVYAEALIDGRWIALDSARVGAAFGLEPERVYRRQYWKLNFNGPQVGLLNGPGLTFDWGSLFSNLPDIVQSTAQVVSAGRGYPTYPVPYQNPYPGGIVTGAGYPPNRGTAVSAGASTNISPLLLVGGLALLVFLIKK